MDFTFVIVNVPPCAINKKNFTDRCSDVSFHHEVMTSDMGRICDWKFCSVVVVDLKNWK